MERNEISLHEVKVYRAFVADKARWFTVNDIVSATDKVAHRTVTHHVRRLLGLGLLDMAEVFPAHKYRWAEKADKRNLAYVLRLQRAESAFGLESRDD